jgi:hypothetical protein
LPEVVTILAEKKQRLEHQKQEEIARRDHRDEFTREQDRALFDFDEDINDLENVQEKYLDSKVQEKNKQELENQKKPEE